MIAYNYNHRASSGFRGLGVMWNMNLGYTFFEEKAIVKLKADDF